MKKTLWVIGIAGTNGAGKDTVGHMLAKYHNYIFISVTELLRNEAKRRKLEVSRQNLREISAEWRRELGLGVLVDKAVAEYEIVRDKYDGVVMASLRNPGEADRVHDLGGTMLWIDADPEVRYNRIQKASKERGRSGEDNKTYEQFVAEEQIEMKPSGDKATLNMSGVKDKSDIILDNSLDDINEFKTHMEKALEL